MEHIQTIELGSPQSTITFSSIPQDYDDLILVHSLRTNRAASNEPLGMLFNSSTQNRSSLQIDGNGSGVFGDATGDLRAGTATASLATANTFGNSFIYISNYTSSNFKSASVDGVSENNATSVSTVLQAVLWSESAAINSIELYQLSSGTQFETGSTASLYGVTAGGDGTVTTA